MIRLATLGIVGAVLVGGCGNSDGGSDAGSSTVKKPVVRSLTLSGIKPDGDTVQERTAVVVGKVSEPGALVDVDGERKRANSRGVFRIRVALDLGDNFLTVKATKAGFEEAQTTITIDRELSAAERRARAERRRQQREAELAELRASAEQLDPELLQKDPDRYAGHKVVMTGEIFQIQEGGENFFLMTTGCSTEYDVTLCDGPEVYVSYDFPTDKTEDDLVTVYGEVQGGYDYETAAGGTNYVGHIEARIIE